MESNSHFESFYYSYLEPQLDAIEIDRKKVVKKTYITLFVCIIAILLVFVIFKDNPDTLIPVAIVGFTLFLITFFALKVIFAQKYKKSFKQNIISLVLSYFKKDLQYFPEQFIPQETFVGSLIFNQSFNRYNGEDLITGTVDSIPISFSELNVQHVTGTGKNRRTTNIFNGVFVVIQNPKNHFGHTIILPDTAERLFGGKIGNFFQSLGKSRGTLVKIDHREFEKEFCIYGSEPNNTLTLLNNTLIENLLDLKKRVGRKIYISFVGNTVNVAVNFTKDMFEPRVFKTVKDFKYMNRQVEFIQFFTDIIKVLNIKRA